MATFRDTLVKEVMGNAQLKAVLEKYAPSIAKNPAAKLMGKKSCGEIFDLVVSKGLLPRETAEKIEAEMNEILNK